ncbi:MAG: hypothetical protein LBF84_03575 [Holosporales bacterium]|nr:hypothetical protein [Holosporales bacterium]
MHNLIKLTGLALLLGYSFQNVVFASAQPVAVSPPRIEQLVFVFGVLQPVASAVPPPGQQLPKNKFTPEEDMLLRELVEQYGINNWRAVANGIPGRNGKQCRERWYLKLDPQVTHTEWTPEEDSRLLELQRLHGNQWATIQCPCKEGRA